MFSEEREKFIQEKLSEPNNYKNRYVAFLDILGFQNLCGIGSGMQNDDKLLKCCEIKATFNDLELLKLDYDEGLSKLISSKEIRDDTTFTIMSDSIVISAPNNNGGLIFILYLCDKIQMMLLSQGILLRGGIAEGEFFQLNNIMFGPALNEAHSIESKQAIYPRIVIANSIIDDLKNKGMFISLADCKSIDDYMHKKHLNKYINKHKDISDKRVSDCDSQIEFFIKQSEDSLYFVNYFNSFELMKIIHSPMVEKIKSTISNGLANPREDIRMKYMWLESYYNTSIDDYININDLHNNKDIDLSIFSQLKNEENTNA